MMNKNNNWKKIRTFFAEKQKAFPPPSLPVSVDHCTLTGLCQKITEKRKLKKKERKDLYFVGHHQYKPTTFGLPLVLPADINQTTWSGKYLYENVRMQLARLIASGNKSSRFNRALDGDEQLYHEYPFVLKIVAKNLNNRGFCRCARCPWFRFCFGCRIECNENCFVDLSDCFVAIDWDITAWHLRYNPSLETLGANQARAVLRALMIEREKFLRIAREESRGYHEIVVENDFSDEAVVTGNVTMIFEAITFFPASFVKHFEEHPSVRESYVQHFEPITLDSCLKVFTQPEELKDSDNYYCSKCRAHCPASKKLDIWRLPPILIVHFKRFQYVNEKWVKSCKMVNFPRKDFNPSKYLAINDCDKRKIFSNLTEATVTKQNGFSKNSDYMTDNAATVDERDFKLEAEVNEAAVDVPDTFEKFLSCGQHSHRLLDDTVNSDELKYDLYAVACHAGMLGAGHYVAYARNINEKWYLYNDSSCKQIDPNDIDGSLAYILFYERRGLDYGKYIPDLTGKTPRNVDAADREIESEFKRACCIQ
uniref:ubiquitinyl hydrolase 1 n=1 Tax=Romanomermis culicivorax TaxID=13658 RepID=A0A915ICD2_ROMCU